MLQNHIPCWGAYPLPPPMISRLSEIENGCAFQGTDGNKYCRILYNDQNRQMWLLSNAEWHETDYETAALLERQTSFRKSISSGFKNYWFHASDLLPHAPGIDLATASANFKPDNWIELIRKMHREDMATNKSLAPKYGKVARRFPRTPEENTDPRMVRPQLFYWHRGSVIQMPSTIDPAKMPKLGDSIQETIKKHAVRTKFLDQNDQLCQWVMLYDGTERVFRQSKDTEDDWVPCDGMFAPSDYRGSISWFVADDVAIYGVFVYPK